jgi:predicted nuclease of predicted toxin-antitoxin system
LIPLLLDQGLPREAAEILRAGGWSVLHVGEIGMGTASDIQIIERAVADGRVIVTLDSDFHAIVAVAGRAEPSVIRIRREGLRAPELADLVTRVVTQTEPALIHGALVSVSEKSMRIHRLPVGAAGESIQSV